MNICPMLQFFKSSYLSYLTISHFASNLSVAVAVCDCAWCLSVIVCVCGVVHDCVSVCLHRLSNLFDLTWQRVTVDRLHG